MAAADKEALNLVADELGVAATWHTGAREAKLNELADKVRAIADGNAAAILEERNAREQAAAEAAAAAGNLQEHPTE